MKDIMLVQCLPLNDLFDLRYQSENLALGYLAAVLRKEKFNIGVLDAHLEGFTPNETVEYLLKESPWMIGFSSSAQDCIEATFHVINLLRNAGYKGHITIGGHFPTYEHEKLMQNVREVDSVVRGEGEITIVELAYCVKNGDSLEKVEGLTYRTSTGEVKVNGNRSLIEDLDDLPFVERDTLDILLKKNRRVSILSSRGCYARCTFCSIQTFFNYSPRRVRSTDNVVEEMLGLYKKGVRKFKFVDDLFIDPSKRSRKWVLELCQKIKEAKMDNLNLWIQTRAVCVREDIFEALLKVGLKKVFLGLESGHLDTLKRYKKNITPEQNLEAMFTLQKIGVPEVSIGMMIFEPDVSIQGIRENVDFLRKLGSFDFRDVTGRFMPYAGTPMTEKLLKEGRIHRKTWFDTGTYDFTEPKVGKLFDMISVFYDQAKPSLKLVYKMDVDLRNLERFFIQPEQRQNNTLYSRYKDVRKAVENYSQLHGELMLSLVEKTIDFVESHNCEEIFIFREAALMFKGLEEKADDTFILISSLFSEVS